MPWRHISPIPGDPGVADIRCSHAALKTKFFVVGDFDADGRTELVVAPGFPKDSSGNDLWAMKYDVGASSWRHMASIPNHPFQADIDCSGREFPAKFAVVADFDGDGADELVVAPDATGSRGNDLWVMKFDRGAGVWTHMAPIPNHAMNADIDCSGLQVAARFAIAGDFDGDGRAELAIVPDAGDSRGNDLWVMKYVGTFPRGAWQHMAPIPQHPMNADIDCSGLPFAAKFVVAADFDGDGRAELAIAPTADGSRGNDFWVMKYAGTFPSGRWQHMAPIPGHAMDADLDCSGVAYPAAFALAGDFDNDGRAELAIAPAAGGSRGNDFWVMKYVGTFPRGAWEHMAPIPGHAMDADLDCSGVAYPAGFAATGDFDGDGRVELAIIPEAIGSRGNDLWVMKYDGTFPAGAWRHMAPIANHQMDADIDCSGSQVPARFCVAADVDRDGSDELVVAPVGHAFADSPFLWVMKYFGTAAGGVFGHLSPVFNHPMDADIFVADRVFPVNALRVGVFDGQGGELLLAPDFPSTEPGANDTFWVVGYGPAGRPGHEPHPGDPSREVR